MFYHSLLLFLLIIYLGILFLTVLDCRHTKTTSRLLREAASTDDDDNDQYFGDSDDECILRLNQEAFDGHLTRHDLELYYPFHLQDASVINLCSCRLTSLDDDSSLFSDLIDLKILNLNQNQLTHVSGSLGGANLIELHLSHNRLQSIRPSNLFANLSRLEILNLSFNKLARIESDSFHGLISLRVLNLTGNELYALESGMFANLGNLRELSLNLNNLREIQANSLDGIQHLDLLDLSHNNLRSISVDIFHAICIRDLYLDKNRFGGANAGDDKIRVLTVVRSNDGANCSMIVVDNNVDDDDSVESIANVFIPTALTTPQPTPPDEVMILRKSSSSSSNSSFVKLNQLKLFVDYDYDFESQFINLNDKMIHEVDSKTFNGYFSLISLDLSFNRIRELKAKTFEGLINLRTLQLNNNRLIDFDMNLFKGGSKLTFINLDHNELNTFDPNIFSSFCLKYLSIEANPLSAKLNFSYNASSSCLSLLK